jgi:hypothetical protein
LLFDIAFDDYYFISLSFSYFIDFIFYFDIIDIAIHYLLPSDAMMPRTYAHAAHAAR